MQKVLFLFGFAILWIACARPSAKFTATPQSTKVPSVVKFENQSEKAEKYIWDFGDGTTDETTDPEKKYYLSGKYQVKLTAIKGKKSNTMSKELFFEAPSDCLVEIQTSLGTVMVKLYDATPQHRDNFIKLVESGYYENTLFHRVINNFMVQGGDPNSRNAVKGARLGMGGPDYKVPAEFSDTLHHFKGALAAARQGDAANPKKASSGSQFYIVHGGPATDATLRNIELQKGFTYSEAAKEMYKKVGGTPFLDMDYTVFGMVVEGLDVIDKIAAVRTNADDRPQEDVVILKMTLIK